jgi:RNA polymerase sigma-70 factor (ECF subfamily)
LPRILGSNYDRRVQDDVRTQLEADVRARCERGDHAGAATAILRGYGPELLGFLAAIHRDEAAASETFAELAETLWRALPRFAWESTARTWAYAVARNVVRSRKRGAARRQRRVVQPGEEFFEEMAQKVRTETLAYLRTEKKTRLQALRDALVEEDRMLLILRVDRGLPWNELARILTETESEEPLDDVAIAREAARLRKRFQLVKDRLRDLARKEGLLE